ncbi:MAG: diacylglycerol kinase [Verrucomicrobia bacterium]|nr:diacylglycerol kinase [Verrucomicrobiota bacterium]
MQQQQQPPPPEAATEPQKATGLIRIVRAAGYSLEGLGSAYKHEAAFRQEVWLAIPLILLALLFPISGIAKALLIGSVALVLVTELLNSAVEWVVDYISQQKHPFAKRAKDMGSAAVMISLCNCAAVWILVVGSELAVIRQWLGI